MAAERDRLAEQVELTRKSNRRASDELDTLQQNAGTCRAMLVNAVEKCIDLEISMAIKRNILHQIGLLLASEHAFNRLLKVGTCD